MKLLLTKNFYFNCHLALRLLVILATFISISEPALSHYSTIKSDEEVILFPTYATPSTISDSEWILEIHGWIFEPELASISRNLLINSLCRSLTLLKEECDNKLFKDRARYFLTDNERNKKIAFAIGTRQLIAEPSGKDGHFNAKFSINETELDLLRNKDSNDWLTIRTLTDNKNHRAFTVKVLPLSTKGISIISDIDDTIKYSFVSDHKELLRNTFTRPFKPISGMSELYQLLAENNVQFHYLSASPWQLYPALSNFLNEYKFPNGTFHLKNFRWKDSKFFDLFISPEKFKSPLINNIIQTFPMRRFILIGDSGEKDPEIYGTIARQFPNQDIRILIRELSEFPLNEERLKSAFELLQPEKYKIVKDTNLLNENGKEDLVRFILNEER